MAAFRKREPAPSIERIGSARRAWLSVRNATAIFAPLWIVSMFLGPADHNGDWADLTWLAIGAVYYVVALVLVLPAVRLHPGSLDRQANLAQHAHARC